jgi:hypothetical protein
MAIKNIQNSIMMKHTILKLKFYMITKKLRLDDDSLIGLGCQ